MALMKVLNEANGDFRSKPRWWASRATGNFSSPALVSPQLGIHRAFPSGCWTRRVEGRRKRGGLFAPEKLCLRGYLVYLAIGAVAFVVLACLLYFTSSHFQAATSDGASVVLEGRTIANGHVLLHGWVLTAASYWTSAAMFDAVGFFSSASGQGCSTPRQR